MTRKLIFNKSYKSSSIVASCSKDSDTTVANDPRNVAVGTYSGNVTYTYINRPSVEGQNDTTTSGSSVTFTSLKSDAGLVLKQTTQDSTAGKFVINATSATSIVNDYFFRIAPQTTFINGENRVLYGSLSRRTNSGIEFDGNYLDNLKILQFQVRMASTTPVDGKVLILATYICTKQ